MDKKLNTIFYKYTETVQNRIRLNNNKSTEKGQLRFFPNKEKELRSIIDDLEKEDEFQQLVFESSSCYSGDFHQNSNWFWKKSVKNFFRRSGYYIDLFENKAVNNEAAFHNYQKSFQRRKIQIRYLAPMEFVNFSEQSMNFGTFQIINFSKEDLDEILSNKINKVFYPFAEIKLNLLKYCWFIYLEESSILSKSEVVDFDLDQAYIVENQFNEQPKSLEIVLRQLTLYNWMPDFWKENQHGKDEEKGWLGFNIPFVLKVDDNLLDSPLPAPHYYDIETEPFIDPQTGEELGDSPIFYFNFEETETEAFKSHIQSSGELLSRLKTDEDNLNFLQIAFKYFIKAFFSKNPLEEMLWHITTLEALLGENKEGVTDRLARRIALILGETNNEKKAIKKKFKRIYGFRCDLVHGRKFRKHTYEGHLRYARDLSRQILFWFLHYINKIQEEIPSNKKSKTVFSRKELLELLDIEKDRRINLKWKLDILPNNFPYIAEWMK